MHSNCAYVYLDYIRENFPNKNIVQAQRHVIVCLREVQQCMNNSIHCVAFFVFAEKLSHIHIQITRRRRARKREHINGIIRSVGYFLFL